jgi:uncharacterized protein (DUF2225 family)
LSYTEGEYQALKSYKYSNPKYEIFTHDKVECPICGVKFGGKSSYSGDRGRYEGVHMHLKYSHRINKKWEREELLNDR